MIASWGTCEGSKLLMKQIVTQAVHTYAHMQCETST